MSSLVRLYRQLDRLQATMWFRIVASVIAVAACGGYFGMILQTSSSLNSQREAIESLLMGQNLAESDPDVLNFAQTGTIVVDGKTYGGEFFRRNGRQFFSNNGDVDATYLANSLMADQVPEWAGSWMIRRVETAWMLLGLSIGWSLLIVWMRLVVPFVMTAVGTALPVGIAWMADSMAWILAMAGIGLLTFTFLLLVRAISLAIHWPYQILAVAHTTIREGSRGRIGLVFIVVLLAILPLLPLALNTKDPLRFQIQTYISWSIGFTYLVAASLTVFFTCASVCFEIRDRQIWLLATKPVNRLKYLLGKWAGVMAINMILLTVAGVSTFTFIQYLSTRPVQQDEGGELDRLAVHTEVLTARVPVRPSYGLLAPEQLRGRVEQLIQSDPELAAKGEVLNSEKRKIAQDIQDEFLRQQRSIASMREKTYRFVGLEKARESGEPLYLQYRFLILLSDEHKTYEAVFAFNGDPDTARSVKYVPTIRHHLPIPASFVREDGTLDVTIANLYEAPRGSHSGSVNFEEADMEVLYKAGSFEANFLRAMTVVWIKLAFLAALAICCSTFLSFPVALLASLTVFLAATLGPYLGVALEQFYPDPASTVDWGNIPDALTWIMKTITRWIASFLVWSLSGFGEYKPTTNLVDGKLIPWSAVFVGMRNIGLIWSGIALLLGFMVMRSRQLAVYSGRG